MLRWTCRRSGGRIASSGRVLFRGLRGPGGWVRVAALGVFLLRGTVWAAGPSPPIPVTASILPLGDFCQRIGGERVAVQVLIPPGASPHTFEPPPSVVAKAATARLFLYVGAG